MINKDLLKITNIYIIKLDMNFNFHHCYKILNKYAIDKINSFHKQEDKLRAFVSTLLQYYYLAKIYKILPENIKIQYTPLGKPFFYLPNGDKANYNISHSGDYIVLAVCPNTNHQIGIDIENINIKYKYKEILPIVFSDVEIPLIKTHKDFYKLWTKKEALLKAIGYGFTNDFYKTTNLNLLDIEYKDSYMIHSWYYDNYYISICIHNAGDYK